MTVVADLEPKRLAELVGALTDSLADLIREHRVSEAEWYAALELLGEVGRADETILLSDVLGLSVVVDRQEHEGRGGTPTNVLGPFWRPAPDLPNPAPLAPEGAPGEPLVVRGDVTGDDGQPVDGARIEVWQCDAAGLYDVQLPDGETRFRGVLTTGPDGRYEIRTVVPAPYEVPKDGPVGRLLDALGRHAYQPAHVHMRVQAEGYADLTTMLFFAGDPWLGDDVVAADCPELTVAIDRGGPVASATFDIRLTAG